MWNWLLSILPFKTSISKSGNTKIIPFILLINSVDIYYFNFLSININFVKGRQQNEQTPNHLKVYIQGALCIYFDFCWSKGHQHYIEGKPILRQKHSLEAHTSAEGHLGYEKCLQGSVNWFWAILMGYFENLLSPKYWLGAFWQKQFFSFWGLLKIFFWPEKIYCQARVMVMVLVWSWYVGWWCGGLSDPQNMLGIMTQS